MDFPLVAGETLGAARSRQESLGAARKRKEPRGSPRPAGVPRRPTLPPTSHPPPAKRPLICAMSTSVATPLWTKLKRWQRLA